jgi:hypothetical protein
MTIAFAPQVVVCPHYQFLLDQCQKALVTWQQHRTHVERASFTTPSVTMELHRLQETYARAHAQLESHEQSCGTCQYVAKIAGLDFESMSNALNRHRRSS